MENDLEKIKALYAEIKSQSAADNSTVTHEIYAELARLTEVPLLENSTESEWKCLSQHEWDAIQMRPTMTIEEISAELSKNSPIEINPFEVEVILKDAQERIEYHVRSVINESDAAGG